MKIVARWVGVIIAVQGIVGLVAPDLFVRFVGMLQTSPLIYAAAVIRVAIGVVLLRAAHQARLPVALRVLGGAIVLGGALTPFIGTQLARLILGWWTDGGAPVVRSWAFASLAIGLFVWYATGPSRRAAA